MSSTRQNYKQIKRIAMYHLPLLLKGNIAAHNSYFLSKVKPKPRTVEISITEKCCLRCIACNVWRKRSTDELTLGEVMDIIDQLKEEGFVNLFLSGGEPLLRSDIFDIIKYANKLHFDIGLFTNGYLVNEEVATKLVENGVSSVSLSLDALGKKYDEMRGVEGAYDRVYNAIKIFLRLKKENKLNSFVISTLIMKPTLDSVLEIIDFGIKKGAPIKFNLLDYTPYFFQNVASQKNELWVGETDMHRLNKLVDMIIKIKRKHPQMIMESYASLEYIRDYFRDPLQKDIPCFRILKNIQIDPRGKVYPCWSVPPIGDLRKEKLSSILSSENYIKRTQKLFKKECPGCSCGYETNLRYDIRNLIREMVLRLKR